MIRFDGVSKIYEGHVHALCNVSFHLGKGEMAFLMGPSGAGKTTLLKLIYGEEFPSDGVVEVAGHDVSHLRRRQIPYLRRRIGVVFQDFRLLSDRTIYENLDLVLLIAGFPASERKKRVLSALASVGLSHKSSPMNPPATWTPTSPITSCSCCALSTPAAQPSSWQHTTINWCKKRRGGCSCSRRGTS
jgi:cell division transport system ATP-binding protein